MIEKQDELFKDFEAIRQIPVVQTLLEVICRTTGMGFAAIARVTSDRWLACSVRDEIQFGLRAGGELELETTICNEIRNNATAVVIDNVAVDEKYLDHHTPRLYGFQSYISFPIFLKDGKFFGTLCAIDPKPAQLDNPKVKGLFSMFVDLLSFHLQGHELIERNHHLLEEVKNRLTYAQDENSQYSHLSNHSLQEPLRKIKVYSDILLNKTRPSDLESVKKYVSKIDLLADDAISMVKKIAGYAELGFDRSEFRHIDLNIILLDVIKGFEFEQTNITVEMDVLPKMLGIPSQMQQLFAHVFEIITTFSKDLDTFKIKVTSNRVRQEDKYLLRIGDEVEFTEILIESRSTVIDTDSVGNIFSILLHKNETPTSTYTSGLADCRKIVFNHGGLLSVKSDRESGASFSVILPLMQIG